MRTKTVAADLSDRQRRRVLQRHGLRAPAPVGFDYRPQLADLPGAKLWRIDTAADYGAVTVAARGRIDLGRIRRNWPDLLRLAGSVHTGAVSASRRALRDPNDPSDDSP